MAHKRSSATVKDSLTVAHLLPSPAGRRAGSLDVFMQGSVIFVANFVANFVAICLSIASAVHFSSMTDHEALMHFRSAAVHLAWLWPLHECAVARFVGRT